MRRRPFTLLAALALTLSLAGGAQAHATGSAHYYGACNASDAQPYNGNGIDWVRNSSVVGAVTGASGRILARALYPCTSGTSGFESKTFLAGADIQGNDAIHNQPYQFVQAGIAKYNGAGPVCSGADTWVSGQTTFVYTPANNNGVLCKAGWYDINNDGVGDDPIGGHTYKFTINQDDIGASDYWQTCITDVGTGIGDCHNISRASGDGGLIGNGVAWWGCEVGNRANAMGVQDNVADATISQTAYEKASNPGVWNYTENSPIFAPWNPRPWYYTWVQDQAGLGEQMNCRTSSHT